MPANITQDLLLDPPMSFFFPANTHIRGYTFCEAIFHPRSQPETHTGRSKIALAAGMFVSDLLASDFSQFASSRSTLLLNLMVKTEGYKLEDDIIYLRMGSKFWALES